MHFIYILMWNIFSYLCDLWPSRLGAIWGGGTHMLRHTGMCRPNGSLFHQESLDMLGPILVKKSSDEGPISQKLRKIWKICRFEAEKPLEMGLDFAKISKKNPQTCLISRFWVRKILRYGKGFGPRAAHSVKKIIRVPRWAIFSWKKYVRFDEPSDYVSIPGGGGGHSTFFQVGVSGPDFRSVGLANWHLPLKWGACERKISKFGGLWAENFQIWGLVSWKFPNLGACELKFG